MAKETKLKPKFDAGQGSWRLSVPANLSDTGKRRNLFFSSKQEALTKADQLKTRKENFGNSLTAMTPAKIAEASEAYSVLVGLNVSLLDVVRAWKADHAARTQSVTLAELFDQFIAMKQPNKKRLGELRQTQSRFSNASELIVSDMRPQHVEAAFAGLTNGALRGHLVKLGTVLRYGIRKGYLRDNVAAAIDRPETSNGEVTVATPATVRALFEDALANDIEQIPALVFGFFCGIRPGGEMQRLDWSDVHSDEVVMKKSLTKPGTKRSIRLCEAAKAWLAVYVARGGVREGKVIKYTSRQLELRRRRNWKTAGFDSIPQDVMRHSFCSYYLTQVGDLTKAILAAGHTRPGVFWAHYYRHVTPEDTQAFYSIMPSAEQTNLVRFTAAA